MNAIERTSVYQVLDTQSPTARVRLLLWVAVWVLALTCVACPADIGSLRPCGDSLTCQCDDGELGVAWCNPEGGFDLCVCESAVSDAGPDSIADGGADGLVLDSFGYTPSNFDPLNPSIDLDQTDKTTTIDCLVTFDSDTLLFGDTCGNRFPTPVESEQSDGSYVVVLAFQNLDLTSSGALELSGSRPVIIAVFGDAIFDGTVDAGGDSATPGAGGNTDCGPSAGEDGTPGSTTGGGGGGFGSAAAAGGHTGVDPSQGQGGDGRGNVRLVPLQGGCAGGVGGECDSTDGGDEGGAGGGGVQISVLAVLRVDGTILVQGGAGPLGCGRSGAGAGGGSGGGILLEGGDVIIGPDAELLAEGGTGGSAAGFRGANGGAGGTADSLPEAGSDGTFSGGGGGGGGFGRIRINTASGCSLPEGFSEAVSTSGC